MALAVKGAEILSYPELHDLLAGLEPTAELPSALTAWWCGEDVSAEELYPALDVGARVAVRSDRARELIDTALDRMRKTGAIT